ncbi:hypothetical protein HNQ02_000702 [Flavobacterium sp. 7E]|nr:hypothetical protein [Flavobacterium sp. 7E]
MITDHRPSTNIIIKLSSCSNLKKSVQIEEHFFDSVIINYKGMNSTMFSQYA